MFKVKRFFLLWVGAIIVVIGLCFLFSALGNLEDALVTLVFKYSWLYRWVFVIGGVLVLIVTALMAWVLNGIIDQK